MQTSAVAAKESSILNAPLHNIEASIDASPSGVSWAAIWAGAAAAAALSLVLFILGFGLGLTVISPWSERGAESSSVGISSIAWIAFTQIFAAGLGGYLAGRLRVKWTGVHGDEVYFRDTAHGFLSWAIASLATATLLGSAITVALSGGLQAGATVASGVGMAVGAGVGGAAMHSVSSGAAAAGNASADNANNDNPSLSAANPLQYFVDALFRSDQPISQQGAQPDQSTRDNRDDAAQAIRIFAYDLRAGTLSAEDKQYLGQLIARRTGLNQADAEKRAADMFYQLTTSVAKAEMTAKDAADKARKAAAHTSLWMFIALLCGAFCASVSAIFGGRQRDAI